MKWRFRLAIGSMLILAFSITGPKPVKASQISGPPPAALQSAIEQFATISSSDTVVWDSYAVASDIPAGAKSLSGQWVYLVDYQIGDGEAVAIAYASQSATNPNLISYNVLYAAAGPMDVANMENVGVSQSVAEELLAP